MARCAIPTRLYLSPVTAFLLLAALALPLGQTGCATSENAYGDLAQGKPDEQTPWWVRDVPNEPGQRLFAVALRTGGESTQDALDKARENLLDKAFAATYRAQRARGAAYERSPRMLRAALETVTSRAPRVLSTRYHDPRTGVPVLAALVSLDFRVWHTAVHGFPPRSGDPFTHALLSAHAAHGDRPYRPKDEEVDVATQPADEADTAPSPTTRRDNDNNDDEDHEEESQEPERDVEEAEAAESDEPGWSLTRPPGRIRVVVVAVPEVRDANLEGWPSAAPDARLLADCWAQHSLAVRNNDGDEDRWTKLEPDPQPRMLAGAQATRERIQEALTEAVRDAAAVVLIYLGRVVHIDGDLLLLTADCDQARLGETALPASWIAELAAESAKPGLVLLDGASPPATLQPSSNEAGTAAAATLGWPTIWPVQYDGEPYVDRLRGHGLVSYFATRAIERNRADQNNDGRVTLPELQAYLDRNVTAASRHRGTEQRPWLATTNNNNTPEVAIVPVQ